MKIKLLSSVISIAVLSGCAGMAQKSDFESFDAKMSVGDYMGASNVALELADYDQKTNEADDLLWAMQAGASLNYAGQYELSTKVLDTSEKMMKNEDTEGTAEKSGEFVGSMLGNDAMLDYEQAQYDGVMTNTIKAWNFIAQGDYQNARIELNRAEERQRRAAIYFSEIIKEREAELKESAGDSDALVQKSIHSSQTQQALSRAGIKNGQWKPYDGYVNPFTTYTYALNLLLTGKTKADYQKAANSFKRVYALTDSEVVKKDYELARDMASSADRSDLDNQVWVVFENGQSAVKEEKRIDLPIFLVSSNVSYAGIALPTIKERGTAFSKLDVNGSETQTIANMDKIISAEFDENFPYILAREIGRVTLKTIAQKQINDENPMVGLAFSALQAASTSADIRTFSALPSQYEATRIQSSDKKVELKAGNFTIPVQLDANFNNHIIYVKAIDEKVQPSVKVINI